MVERPGERWPVHARAGVHEEIFFLRESLPEQGEAQERHEREREEQRADKCRGDGIGHGRENAAFVALQGEDRDMGGNDNQHRE